MTDKELADIVLEYIRTIYTGEIKVEVTDILKDTVINLYVPATETCILCNSCFDHRTVYRKEGTSFKMNGGKNNTYHFKVSRQLREMGKRPIQIWEDQWLDTRLQPTIKAILKAALNVNDTTKIYARNCEVKEVPVDEYKKFCNANHTQLSRAASVRLGLYHKGELVQVASFNKYHALNKAKAKDPSKAKSTNYDWDFVRGCEAFNHSRVIGGVSKLFKYFVKTYNPKNVLCYSDFNFFNGIGYANAGFNLIGYTGSDKFYINPTTMTRINRSASHYKQYMEKVITDEWYCCYGAGSLIFFWENPAMTAIQPPEDLDESK